MALVEGSKIDTAAILDKFKTTVVTKILENAYHAGNIPYCRGVQCVPTSIMDHLNNLSTTPFIGQNAAVVSATTILNGLISVVRDLTRVGTFAFTLGRLHTSNSAGYLSDPKIVDAMNRAAALEAAALAYNGKYIDQYTEPERYKEMMDAISAARTAKTEVDTLIAQWGKDHADDTSGSSYTEEIATASGKVIFTKAQVRQAFNGPTDKSHVEYGEIIKAGNLNNLMAAIYSSWNSASRYQHKGYANICHVSCHFNCHSNCHFNCHSACHGWTVIKNA